ncbi:MAG: nucleotidyltransferase domain-containing protein [Planctomycetaceae bacterium]
MNIDPRVQSMLDEHPYPRLFVTISGAHLYGFPSPESDYDLRGVHLLPLRIVVGMKSKEGTYDRMSLRNGLEIDIVTQDAGKFFFSLLHRHDGCVLEHLYSPLVIETSPAHEELKAIARKCVTKNYVQHYRGFADTQWKRFYTESLPIKRLLYVYRLLLTGIHLMKTGEVESNLARLNDNARLPYIDGLIARKTAGPTKGLIASNDFVFHEKEFIRLRDLLEQESRNSSLPEKPGGLDALDDLLVRVRLGSVV